MSSRERHAFASRRRRRSYATTKAKASIPKEQNPELSVLGWLNLALTYDLQIKYIISLHAYRVGQNTGLFWALITQRRLVVERRLMCQKFWNFNRR